MIIQLLKKKSMSLDKILLVDDDDISNFLSQRLIEKLSLSKRFFILKNGKEAFDFIFDNCQDPETHKMCPELIFLDYKMPIMDGKEMIIALKEAGFTNWEDVVIVVFGASLIQRDVEDFRSLGVKEFIEKPLTEEKIEIVLRKYFPKVASKIFIN
jgi:CheY-like chemotaxis protein